MKSSIYFVDWITLYKYVFNNNNQELPFIPWCAYETGYLSTMVHCDENLKCTLNCVSPVLIWSYTEPNF